MKELSKEVIGGEVVIGNKKKITITREEFERLGELLGMGTNKGFMQTKKGDWFNLAYVSEIKKINKQYNC